MDAREAVLSGRADSFRQRLAYLTFPDGSDGLQILIDNYLGGARAFVLHELWRYCINLARLGFSQNELMMVLLGILCPEGTQ